MTTHMMFDGKLQVYRRGDAWHCAARVGGRRFRKATGEEDLDRAKDWAEEWYLDLRGKRRAGLIEKEQPKERTFRHAAEGYLSEIRVLAISLRSPRYVDLLELRMKRHILPYFGDKPLSSINRGLVQAYRAKRAAETIEATAKDDQPGKPPARSTMMQEVVHIRQVLKWAEGMGWLPYVPNLNPPYKTQGKKVRRAWFSPDEYTQLRTATKALEQNEKRRGWHRKYEDLHDFVVFMANTGLRPDEALRLQVRDVKVIPEPGMKNKILALDVRGKVGPRYAVSLPGAIYPFERLVARRRLELELAAAEAGELKDKKWNALLAARRAVEAEVRSGERVPTQPLPRTTLLFPRFSRSVFNEVLKDAGLKFDRDGQVRTAYSLRHTYISNRLEAGANIHQVANNCGTSVKMIEDHYGAHIKDRRDPALLNVRGPKRREAKPHRAAATPDGVAEEFDSAASAA
jgi:integrase